MIFQPGKTTLSLLIIYPKKWFIFSHKHCNTAVTTIEKTNRVLWIFFMKRDSLIYIRKKTSPAYEILAEKTSKNASVLIYYPKQPPTVNKAQWYVDKPCLHPRVFTYFKEGDCLRRLQCCFKVWHPLRIFHIHIFWKKILSPRKIREIVCNFQGLFLRSWGTLSILIKFLQGDGTKLRFGMRKFFSHYGIKVRTSFSKSVETIFIIFIHSMYTTSSFIERSFRRI